MSPFTYMSMNGFHYWPLALLGLWVIPWKGWALWRAARLGSKPWFIALLIINTAGILEIIYLFIITDKNGEKKSGRVEAKKE